MTLRNVFSKLTPLPVKRKSPAPLREQGFRIDSKLLNFQFRARFFELCDDSISFRFGNTALNRLRGSVNQILGFFQAQSGDFADNLDYADLVGASSLQDDIKRSLFFSSSDRSRSGSSGSRRGRGRHAELGFEGFHEFIQLEDAHRFNLSDKFFCNSSHFQIPP